MSKGEAKIRIIPAQEARADVADDTAPSHAAAPPVSALGRLYHRCQGEEPRGSDCAIVLYQRVYDEITAHLGSDTTREHGGLLLGYERQVSEKEVEVWITHSLQAAHTEATSARLTFTEETWAEFDHQTEALCGLGLNLRRVGWYHSHPNHGVFLSSYDLNVCAEFTRPTHVALVVDPIRNEGGFFVNGEEGYRPHKPQGFWELLEGGEHSVINWRNVSPAVPGEPAPPQGTGVDAAQAESADVVNLPSEEPGEPPDAELARPGGQANDATPESRPDVIRIRAAAQAETGAGRSGGLLPGVPRWALLLVAIVAPALLAAPTVNLVAQAVEWVRNRKETAALGPSAPPAPTIPLGAAEIADVNGTGAPGAGTQSPNSSTNTSGAGPTHGAPITRGRRNANAHPRREERRRRTNSNANNTNVNNTNANNTAKNSNANNTNAAKNSNANNNNTQTKNTDGSDAEEVDDGPEREAGEGTVGRPASSHVNRATRSGARRRGRPGPTPAPARNTEKPNIFVRGWRRIWGDQDK